MKAIVVKKHGDVDQMELRDLAAPVAKAGELLIAVKTAGINFADILSRLGIYKAAQGRTTLEEVARELPRVGKPRPLAQLLRLLGD